MFQSDAFQSDAFQAAVAGSLNIDSGAVVSIAGSNPLDLSAILSSIVNSGFDASASVLTDTLTGADLSAAVIPLRDPETGALTGSTTTQGELYVALWSLWMQLEEADA